MAGPLRVYEPHELGDDGYPLAWHDLGLGEPLVWEANGFDVATWTEDGTRYGVKHLVRAQAGNRCERCGHPFVVGASGEWEMHQGESETMPDGPEMLEAWVELEPKALDTKVLRGTLWSSCDIQCTHGLERCRVKVGDEWSDLAQFLRNASAISGVRADLTLPSGFHAAVLRVQAAWRILTVHHLNGRKYDLRWWNLAALCQRCHLEIQNKVVMERVYPLEHTDWFKAHAAGWYAYAYKGEDLTREETMERLDELLGLEQMA